MGSGEVVTVDVEKLHALSHPRVTYLIGDSTSDAILSSVRMKAAAAFGPVMVILDSDHTADHVRRELAIYAPLVTPGSYCLVQDGVIDTLPVFMPADLDRCLQLNNFWHRMMNLSLMPSGPKGS